MIKNYLWAIIIALLIALGTYSIYNGYSNEPRLFSEIYGNGYKVKQGPKYLVDKDISKELKVFCNSLSG
ncbi:MAG: hypothetical protein CVU89_15490 [Firmicutes bacterium HGW-Firmicutes-14]|jgi:hypothetical protein|nr:MAG: hypothetical protein CVU89_15490 [Firmicutes bacterium HGW-Firmicutes-14]